MHLHPRCWKLVVAGPEDLVDQDLEAGLKRHVERLSGVCQALGSVIALLLEDSALSKQLAKKRVGALLVVPKNGREGKTETRVSLRPL